MSGRRRRATTARAASRWGTAGMPLSRAPGLDVAHHARLGGDHGAIADPDVIVDAHLAPHDHVRAHGGAAGDAHLGHEDRVLAHRDVVGDVDLVVDLGPAADDGLAVRGAVDGDVGAQLDVVLDGHPASLGDLVMPPLVRHEAEAVAADHRPAPDDDARADSTPRQDGRAGIHDGVVTHRAVVPDEDPRVEGHPIAQSHPIAQGDERPDRRMAPMITPRPRASGLAMPRGR